MALKEHIRNTLEEEHPLTKIDFYTNPQSRGRIVRWMLEETALPYETHILTYDGTMKDAAYRAINPMGKVPAISHNGKIVTECAAICAYLAEVMPDAVLAPTSEERADYYRWMFFAAGPLESATVNRALGFTVPEERERMVGYGHFNLVLDTLEKALSGKDYMTGSRFTAADVYVGSQIIWGLQFGTLDERPGFKAYAERLAARPAYAEANRLDDEAAAAM